MWCRYAQYSSFSPLIRTEIMTVKLTATVAAFVPLQSGVVQEWERRKWPFKYSETASNADAPLQMQPLHESSMQQCTLGVLCKSASINNGSVLYMSYRSLLPYRGAFCPDTNNMGSSHSFPTGSFGLFPLKWRVERQTNGCVYGAFIGQHLVRH